MLTLKKQYVPLAPLPREYAPLPALAERMAQARKTVELCRFLRLNPLRAADREVLRFLAS